MKINKLMFLVQLSFGAIVTCLAVYIFVNLNSYSLLSIQDQLNTLWILNATILLIYGMIQLSQGLVEMLEVSKEISK